MSHITTTQPIPNTAFIQSHADSTDYININCIDNCDLILYFCFVLYGGLFTLSSIITIIILITTTIPIIINFTNILPSSMYTELHSICVITSYSATSSFNIVFSHVTSMFFFTDAYVHRYTCTPVHTTSSMGYYRRCTHEVTDRTKPTQYSTPSII